MKKNKVSKRKSKRKQGGHLKSGVGFSLTRSSFDNGCGVHGKRKTRAVQFREALADAC
jgi:hypothetical protein